MASDLKALEERIRTLLGGALIEAGNDGTGCDWRRKSDNLADEIIRWVADVVEDATSAALAGAEQATTDARQAYEHLNRPMLDRLRKCAADTSPNWDGVVTVYPPETRGLVALIDAVGALAADVPAAADDCPICTHALSGHRSNIIPGTETKALRCDICGPCDGPDAAADHEHPGGYLSTACLHELHEPECGAAQRARGYVGHPTCKFCNAKCVCPCHAGGQVERAERVHVDGCTLAAVDPHHAGWCVLAVGAVSGSGEPAKAGGA